MISLTHEIFISLATYVAFINPIFFGFFSRSFAGRKVLSKPGTAANDFSCVLRQRVSTTKVDLSYSYLYIAVLNCGALPAC